MANLSGAEQRLADAAARAMRQPIGKLALALHLGRLRPPGPQPHHVRVARALLQSAAQRFGGQVFPLSNADLVLICVAPDDDRPPGGASPLELPADLARLFAAEETVRLTTLWRLDVHGGAFRAYLATLQSDPATAGAAADDKASCPGGLAALPGLVAQIALPEQLTQQTAIILRPPEPGREQPITTRIVPLFRELTVPLAPLAAHREAGNAIADPYLLRHVTAGLDARMLELLRTDLDQGGRLTRPALRLGLPLHVNLTLEGIVSPGFARLVQSARRAGARVAVEISMIEAAADPPMMEYARSLLEVAGFPLVLDSVDAATLLITHPGALRPDLVKLTWAEELARAPPALTRAIDAALARVGGTRILLAQAASEAALAWGQAHGIARYQGMFLDAMQAAARIAVCHSARACTLRQCMTRAGTPNPALRTGCGNLGLLDGGAASAA